MRRATTQVAGALQEQPPGLADSPWRNRHAEGYKRPSTANVVEADAFIMSDPHGRKRILIGNLWPAASGEWCPGVALYDEHCSEGVCLLLGDAGPVLSFAYRGDTCLELGLLNNGDRYVAAPD